MIKDQCDNCRKNGTANCSQTIIFNSLSCEYYSKKLDLTKDVGGSSSSTSVTSPTSPTPSLEPNSSNGLSSTPVSFWKQLFSFNGRNRRTCYWLTTICADILYMPALVSGEEMSEGVAIYTLLFTIPVIWVLLANMVKRCHDLGKSGFFILLQLIPIVNIIIGIYIAFFKGEQHDNEYSPSPY